MTLDDTPYVADPLGCFAIGAKPGLHTGIFQSYSYGVDRCGVMLDPLDGRIQIRGDAEAVIALAPVMGWQ